TRAGATRTARDRPGPTALEEGYVDELYDAIIVRPVMWLSREVLWKIVDARIVDGLLVNGTAAASRAVGWLGSRLQTGAVGVYVVLFVIGVLAVVGAAVR